jgi:hypothetical protein
MKYFALIGISAIILSVNPSAILAYPSEGESETFKEPERLRPIPAPSSQVAMPSAGISPPAVLEATSNVANPGGSQ